MRAHRRCSAINAVAAPRSPLWRNMSDAEREAFYADAAASTPVKDVAEADQIALSYGYLIEQHHATGTVMDVEGAHCLSEAAEGAPMKIAFLGLGRMGRELAAHVLAAEHELTVWNRTASAAEGLVQRGARLGSTAARAVAGADAVITVLFGPDAVRDVVIDADLPIRPDALWIDVTTVAPADANAFATWAGERQVRYVHSPVIGSLGPARARALGVLLGGAAGVVEAARPIVSLWADPERLREYDSPAKAATGKLVANLSLAVAIQGVVEALRLGHSGGLSTDEVLATLDRTPLSIMKDLKGDSIRSGRFGDTQFSADLLNKDTRLMLHSSVYPLPATTAASESLEAARRAGRGGEDFAVVAADDS